MDSIEEMIQNLELLRMHFGDITKTCMANGIIDSTIKAIDKFRTYEDAERQGLPDGYGAGAKYAHTEKPQTNADRIRSMTDEELAEWLTNMCEFEKDEEPYKSIYNLDAESEEEIRDSYGDLLKWLKAESEG